MKGLLATCAPHDRGTWEATVRALWDGACYREERYAAIDLCGHRSARAWQDLVALPLYEHLIVDGAWWDHVDSVAIHLVGPILRAHPAEVAPTIRRWATEADRWRRRSAVIVQNGAKDSTDTGLLTFAVEANVGDRDFFIRKGIGWALREYAKTNPEWVRAFVAGHAALPAVPPRSDQAPGLTMTASAADDEAAECAVAACHMAGIVMACAHPSMLPDGW